MSIAKRLAAGLTLAALLTTGAYSRPVGGVPASAWEIGPVIKGRNYSPGLQRPSLFANGWGFAIGPRSGPHYVTFPHGSLRGKRQIRMRFRVDGPRGAIIHGAKCAPGSPSAVTLYFQRQGDNWATDGERWWAQFASVSLNGPTGERQIVAPLNGPWRSVLTMTAASHPAQFARAKAEAGRVGFTFANCEGLGHGARASQPVRFVVTDFRVL